MSFPTTAPARHAASSTDARQVSTEIGVSKRSRKASTGGTPGSSSSASSTSGPGPALPPPTSSRSAPSSTNCSARRKNASSDQVAPRSKNESGVRLRMPITSARARTSNVRSPRRNIGNGTTSTGTEAGYRRDPGRYRDTSERAAPVECQRHCSAGASNGCDPGDQERGGLLQQWAETRRDPGDRARDKAVDAERLRRGRGEQVRERCDQRERAERDQQHRQDPELGRDRHGERLTDGARAREPARDRRLGPRDAGTRAAGQQEADAVHQERIDEQ